MTFADLYHLDKKCRNIEKELEENKPSADTDFKVTLALSTTSYEDFKDIIKAVKELVYDLCQAEVKDVIRRDT